MKANASNIPERSKNFAQQLRLTNYGNQGLHYQGTQTLNSCNAFKTGTSTPIKLIRCWR